jgi:hypothetical protein
VEPEYEEEVGMANDEPSGRWGFAATQTSTGPPAPGRPVCAPAARPAPGKAEARAMGMIAQQKAGGKVPLPEW